MRINVLKKATAVLLALLMVFILCACAQEEAPTPSGGGATSDSEPAPTFGEGDDFQQVGGEKPAGIQPGTEFTYSVNYDLPTYVPWLDTRSTFLAQQVFDNLLYKYHADQNDVRGNLAESWEVSDDGLLWVFQIKQDAYFTNGSQVTAEAFVKSWDAAKDYQPRFFAPVEGYEATGEFELTVTLHSPSATFIYDLPMQPQTGVVDPQLLDQYGPEDSRVAVGCGPYYIESYISGEGFVLKANPDYHNPDRMPSIETVNFTIIPDENTAVIALMNNEVDSLSTLNIEVYNNLVDSGWNVAVVEDRVNPFWFNAREVELFRDHTVREALCHMIDWQAVADLVYDGVFLVPESMWAGPGSYPYGDNYAYDPERGIQMLEDAGYSKDDITFTMLAAPDHVNMEIAILGQLQELGFNNITMEQYDAATCFGMLKSGTYQLFPIHNGYGVESPLGPYSMGLLPEGSQRVMWLEYMDEDAYAETLDYYSQANTAPDFETYEEAISQITRICQEQNVTMGGLQFMRIVACNERFGGLFISPITGYFDFCYLWDTEVV